MLWTAEVSITGATFSSSGPTLLISPDSGFGMCEKIPDSQKMPRRATVDGAKHMRYQRVPVLKLHAPDVLARKEKRVRRIYHPSDGRFLRVSLRLPINHEK